MRLRFYNNVANICTMSSVCFDTKYTTLKWHRLKLRFYKDVDIQQTCWPISSLRPVSGQDVDAPVTRTAGRLGRVATTPLTDVGVGRHDDQLVLLRLHDTVRRLWNREREMVYLTTHSTHFIYGYMERERNGLFNDALNTFYLWLYGEREKWFI